MNDFANGYKQGTQDAVVFTKNQIEKIEDWIQERDSKGYKTTFKQAMRMLNKALDGLKEDE